jgi:tRNA-dihydrouridine synthase A
MLGRQAYQEPYLLAELHNAAPGSTGTLPDRSQVLLMYADYVDRQLAAGHRFQAMVRHVLGLYTGQPNARAWRRSVTQQAAVHGATGDVLRRSLDLCIRSRAA